METIKIGEVILVLFPFSDLKGHKLRPALVLAESEFKNVILCQITSKPYSSKTAVKLTKKDFSKGALPIDSYIRPDKIFTADVEIIEKVVGRLSEKKIGEVLGRVRELFK